MIQVVYTFKSNYQAYQASGTENCIFDYLLAVREVRTTPKHPHTQIHPSHIRLSLAPFQLSCSSPQHQRPNHSRPRLLWIRILAEVGQRHDAPSPKQTTPQYGHRC
jgi:hypothetical protein